MLNEQNNLLIYKDKDGNVVVDAIYKDETLWLTQKGMAKVFDVGISAISKHLKNIFEDQELDEKVVVSKMENTTRHGAIENRTQTNEVKIYNLDAIIAVGYRVNSKKATEFRIWATKVLKEYIIKGFALNDERFIRGNKYDAKYFDELLERIKTIRVSERMSYQKITDLFIATSTDYNPKSEEAYTFFKIVQNKLHYAISGYTVAELIYNRVNANKKHMGLTNWKNSPDGPIYRYDVLIAKNYLDEKELKDLNKIVTMYLDYAELQAENHNAMTMKDWIEKLNVFLQFNGKEILHNAGKISAKVAQELAYREYDKFKVKQDKLYKSDFDNFLDETTMIEKRSDKNGK